MYVLYKLSDGSEVGHSADRFYDPGEYDPTVRPAQNFNKDPSLFGVIDTKNTALGLERGVWHSQDLEYKPQVVKRIISTEAFIERFLESEFENICVFAGNNNAKANAFITFLVLKKNIDLDSDMITNSLTSMVSANILTPARKTAILS